METGYIKLPRTIMEWEWYRDGNTMRILIHLMLKRAFAGYHYLGVEIAVGEVPTTIRQLSVETGLTVSQVRSALERLQLRNHIELKRHSKFIVIKTNFDFLEEDNRNHIAITDTIISQSNRNPPYIYNKNEKNDKNDASDISKMLCNEDLAMIITCWEENIAPASHSLARTAMEWMKMVTPELICHIIRYCGKNGHKTQSYIGAAIKNSYLKGVKTVDEWRDDMDSVKTGQEKAIRPMTREELYAK